MNAVIAECKECIRQWKAEKGGTLPIEYGEHVQHCYLYGGDWLHGAIDYLLSDGSSEWVEEELTERIEDILLKENVGFAHANRIKIGNQITRLRNEKGLLQEEVAERSGVIRTTISKVEQGRFNVGIDVIGRISDAMDAEVKIVEKRE